MNDPELYWFHCGRCGKLFQAHAGADERKICIHCGEDSVPMMQDLRDTGRFRKRGSQAVFLSQHNQPIMKPSVKKSANLSTRILVIFLTITIGLCFYIISNGLNNPFKKELKNSANDEVNGSRSALMGKDQIIMDEALPICKRVLMDYLKEKTPAGKSFHVISGDFLLERMVAYYAINPVLEIDVSSLRMRETSVISLTEGPAIVTRWETARSEWFEVVFREENGAWKIDWEHFVRYGDYPWSLFIVGDGPAEGEFRLLARERVTEGDKDLNSLSIALYVSRFKTRQEVDYQEPMQLLSRSSNQAQRLLNAFEAARKDQQAFGLSLPNVHQKDMIPVRVRVRRLDSAGRLTFQILEVAACHWYSSSDFGLELPLEKDSKTQE